MKIKKVLGLVFPLVIVFGFYSCQTSMPTSDLELSGQGVNQEYEKVGLDSDVLPKALICTDCCEGFAPMRVCFDASKCSGKINSYVWEEGKDVLSREKQFKYVFDTPGTYIINLTVRDNQHRTATDLIKIKVVDPSKHPKDKHWAP